MYDLEKYVKILKIKNFRGVFMRDDLPDIPWKIECGIINLGDCKSRGTHWVCYMKTDNVVIYYDSYCCSNPPVEFIKYMNNNNVKYNTSSFQTYDDPPICGHLCLEVLRRFSLGENWKRIESALKENKYVWENWFL